MIRIRHVLKDGTELPDITGHVVKASEHGDLFEALDRMKKEGDACAAVQAPD